jgi:SAM-dependent methyltransferase
VTRLPERARRALRCPVCTDAVDLDTDTARCVNTACGTTYPVLDGVPVLVNEARSVFTIDGFRRRNATFFRPRARLLAAVDRRLPELQRAKSRRIYERLAPMLLGDTDQPLVLVVGGGITGRGMEPLLERCPPIELVETDVSWAPRTALICDGHDLPFADGTFDGVIAQAVLEHVVDPRRCVDEIHRVLKPGGLVYAQTPFMQQVHAGAYDFTRFTLLGHRRLFNRFSEVESGAGNGPGSALAWSWQYFLLSFAESPAPRAALRAFARLSAFWLKYVDILLERKAGALDAAVGYFFIGRRSEETLSDRELVTLYRGGIT